MLLPIILLVLLNSICGPIDYDKRIREPAREVEYVYTDDAGKMCSALSGEVALDTRACTVFPYSSSMKETSQGAFRKAVVVLPNSEKDNPGCLTEHENGHVQGFDHKEFEKNIQ